MRTSQYFFGLTATGVAETIEEYNDSNNTYNVNWGVKHIGQAVDGWFLVLERD